MAAHGFTHTPKEYIAKFRKIYPGRQNVISSVLEMILEKIRKTIKTIYLVLSWPVITFLPNTITVKQHTTHDNVV